MSPLVPKPNELIYVTGEGAWKARTVPPGVTRRLVELGWARQRAAPHSYTINLFASRKVRSLLRSWGYL